MSNEVDKCYACGKQLTAKYLEESSNCIADTKDAQLVYVGKECMRKIMASGSKGYQPPKGGPRLFQLGMNKPIEHKRGSK